MKGWSVPLCAVCLLSIAPVAGCGGERKSGAAPAGDTAAVAGPDTAAAPAPDTTAAATADTSARRDPAAAPAPTPPVAAGTKPVPKPAAKPKAAEPAAPAPAQASDTATAAANAPLSDPYHTAPLDTVSQVVYDGWKQFNLNCARCHGEDVQGTTIAPHLIVSLRPDGTMNTKELFVQTVCAGRPEKGMPAWCALGMEMPKIEAIYSYVKGRSDGKIHPGRPAVRRQG